MVITSLPNRAVATQDSLTARYVLFPSLTNNKPLGTDIQIARRTTEPPPTPRTPKTATKLPTSRPTARPLRTVNSSTAATAAAVTLRPPTATAVAPLLSTAVIRNTSSSSMASTAAAGSNTHHPSHPMPVMTSSTSSTSMDTSKVVPVKRTGTHTSSSRMAHTGLEDPPRSMAAAAAPPLGRSRTVD